MRRDPLPVATMLSEPLDRDVDMPPKLGPQPWLIASVLLLVVVAGITDIVLDRPQSIWSVHILAEVGIVLLSLGLAIQLFRGWRRSFTALGVARASAHAAAQDAALHRAERDNWRRRAEQAILGFSTAIDRQFDEWKLSKSEREVALLLLKGEGHKQAAAILNRSERTVRQHAVEIYRKAGLQGRAELAAFFLEDLVHPTPTGSNRIGSGDESP